MDDVYDLLYQVSTQLSCSDYDSLHRWPCYRVCLTDTPFLFDRSTWGNMAPMTAGRRWGEILGFFMRQLWRQSKPNGGFWVTDLPARDKLTSTHHGIDFTSQHWQGSQPKSHTLPAHFIRLKSSPQREQSHQRLFIFFFFSETKCSESLEPTWHTEALHWQALFYSGPCSFAVFSGNKSSCPLLISCKYYTFPNQWLKRQQQSHGKCAVLQLNHPTNTDHMCLYNV